VRGDGMNTDLRGAIKRGMVQIKQVDPAELSPGELANQVRDAVEHGGARVVVIDSLNGYLNAMPEERFLIIQMHEMLTYLGQRGVLTILVVAQHGMMGPGMVPPVDTSYLADSVVMLRYFEHGGEIRQAISVVKKRSGGHERALREFAIRSSGIHVGRPLNDFRGVLTGVPTYTGTSHPLIEKSDAARSR
jgi:circadian clock protein KaiC